MTAEMFRLQNRFSGKSFEVIGYTADADTCCPDCAEERYPEGWLAAGGIMDKYGQKEGNRREIISIGKAARYFI